jgi:hypothetical protein
VLAACRLFGVAARPWFVCDRGADFWELFEFATQDKEHPVLLTVRASANRRVTKDGGKAQQVRKVLQRQKERYRTSLEIPAGEQRKGRKAQLAVRAGRVKLCSKRGGRSKLSVVWVREVGRVPKGEKRLDWLLWTTAEIRTSRQIKEVVRGYELRWQIEVFHKTWKSVCGVEKSQLRSLEGLKVWVTLLAIVATRIQRMLHLARKEPELPASEELTEDELQALILLSEAGELSQAATWSIKRAVEVIAKLGGYTGKSSGGPPGAITLGRGLAELAVAVAVLQFLQERSDPKLFKKLLASVK